MILDLNTHKYFSLNESGAMIWDMIEAGKSTDEVASALAAHYSLELDKAQQDVRTLVEKLVEAGLLEKAS